MTPLPVPRRPQRARSPSAGPPKACEVWGAHISVCVQAESMAGKLLKISRVAGEPLPASKEEEATGDAARGEG